MFPKRFWLVPRKPYKMSMATNYRYEVERPGAKNLRKALKRQEQRIKVGVAGHDSVWRLLFSVYTKAP